MGKFIDEVYWRQALMQPDWYITLSEDFQRLEKLAELESDYSRRKLIKGEAYELVESMLKQDLIPLAINGDNLDSSRLPIDTAVIHHTKNTPGMTLDRLNAMQLLRVYGMYYANPRDETELHFKGSPVWSGHFYNGQQVFWVYHWLIRDDGKAEQILKDEYIGWHSGNWNINTRSIGICIDDDLTDKEPSDAVIEGVADVIRKHYPSIISDNIIGYDANKKLNVQAIYSLIVGNKDSET